VPSSGCARPRHAASVRGYHCASLRYRDARARGACGERRLQPRRALGVERAQAWIAGAPGSQLVASGAS
jgi:hypothetical protein